MKNAPKDEGQDITSEETEIPSRRPLEGRELMTWTVNAMPQITPGINLAFGSVGLIPLGMILYGYFGVHLAGKYNFYLHAGIVWFCMWLYFWRVGFRQKTVYHYRITDQGAEMEYYLHYPKHFRTFFKGFAIVLLIVVLGLISVDPVFIWMLAGPGGMAIMASKSLITWKNEIRFYRFTWDRPNWIFIDRERNFITVKRRHIPGMTFQENYLGFDIYLPKGKLDEILSIIKIHAPANTDYEEGRWSEKVEIADMRAHLQEQQSP